MYTSKDIAEFFLAISKPEDGDLLSNLKIQKLVYYAQAYYLGAFGEPLFEEDIEAWDHGPVVPSLYQQYKIYSSNQIPRDEKFNPSIFDDDTLELLEEVYFRCGQFAAWKLREMTRKDKPWQEAYNEPGAVQKIISKESLMKSYENKIEYKGEEDDDELAKQAIKILDDPSTEFVDHAEVRKSIGLET